MIEAQEINFPAAVDYVSVKNMGVGLFKKVTGAESVTLHTIQGTSIKYKLVQSPLQGKSGPNASFQGRSHGAIELPFGMSDSWEKDGDSIKVSDILILSETPSKVLIVLSEPKN